MKSNEQRAKEAEKLLMSTNNAYSIILDSLNAATKHDENKIRSLTENYEGLGTVCCRLEGEIKKLIIRITELNDALKPFAIHYNDETAGLQKKPAGRLVLSGDYTVIHVCHFRRAAAVIEGE